MVEAARDEQKTPSFEVEESLLEVMTEAKNPD